MRHNAKIVFAIFLLSQSLMLASFTPQAKATSETIYGDVSDSEFQKLGNDYATVRDAVNASVIGPNALDIMVGQVFYSYPNEYRILRSAFVFNTTNLPNNALISDATLTLTFESYYVDVSFFVVVQNGQPTYPHIPMELGDYDRTLYSGNGGQVNMTTSPFGVIPQPTVDIELNDYGKIWINKTGLTKFMLRSSRDIEGIAPQDSIYESVGFYSADNSQNLRPKLTVTYVSTPFKWFVVGVGGGFALSLSLLVIRQKRVKKREVP